MPSTARGSANSKRSQCSSSRLSDSQVTPAVVVSWSVMTSPSTRTVQSAQPSAEVRLSMVTTVPSSNVARGASAHETERRVSSSSMA